MKRERSSDAMAIAVCLLGLFVLLVGLDLIPANPESFQAPHWIVGLCGLLFFLAGASILASGHPPLRLSIVAILLAVFSIVAGWMALFSGPEGWQGGIPFLQDSVNSVIARLLVGSGALVLLVACLQVIRQIIRRDYSGLPGNPKKASPRTPSE